MKNTKQNKIRICICWIILGLCGCEKKPASSGSDVRTADAIFREFVSPAVQTLTYPFDSKETQISPAEKSRWVVFDISVQDWEELKKQNRLSAGDNYFLKMVGDSDVDDTGFQGYLDGDFAVWRDKKKGGAYFVRELDGKFLRVVFFKRDT